MTANTDLINRAADYLADNDGFHSYEPRGLHLHHDTATGSWWMVDDEDLQDLGARLANGHPEAYSGWCSGTSGTELDMEDIVLSHDADDETDLVALMHEAGQADDMITFMALRFLADEIADIIAVNAEIASVA